MYKLFLILIFLLTSVNTYAIEPASDSLSTNLLSFRTPGYMNFSSMGLLLGSASNERQAQLSLLSEHNYRLNNVLALGITTGIELLKETTVPVAANFKFFIPVKRSDLFIGFTSGYNFSVENPEPGFITSFTGGVLLNFELGCMIPLSKDLIFLALGYRYNELHYGIYNWWNGDSERTYYFNRISLRMGWVLY